MLPRRRVLLTSAATLPLLLAAAGCRSADAFSGPDPLAGPPRPAPDVITLEAVIAAEHRLVGLYQAAIIGESGATARAQTLRSLLDEHEQHLVQLRARLIVPPGTQSAVMPSPSPAAALPSPTRVTDARLRAAEHASAAGLVRRLATVEPGLAQLFASIAASDATHVTALGGAP
jgi:hypothetical protein